jgi:hypothetical protein
VENEIKTEVNPEVVGIRVVLNVVTVVNVANGGQLSGGVNSGIMATSGLPSRRATPKSNNVRGDFKKLIRSEYRS